MNRLPILLLPILLLMGATTSIAAIKDPVQVQGGLVAGTLGTAPGVRVYKGIPFAAPPVGDLRWRDPQPPVPWSGVKQATEFSSRCVQEPRIRESLYWGRGQPISEDCLYLNVWTPAKSPSSKLAVMVWIYGGAFTQESGSRPVFDGDNLAAKGNVIVVTFNYRLGAFGFLALPELTSESEHHASGNYGLLDQNAALRWVHQNIAAFGGDPDTVTIFGQSAGAMSVADLVASPLSNGLFIRSIGESGGILPDPHPRTLPEAEEAGVAFSKSAGANSLAELRKKTSEQIMQAQARQQGHQFGAIVDGYFLPQDVYTIFAEGKENHVAMMGGANAHEGRPAGTDSEARAPSDRFYWMSRTWARFLSRLTPPPTCYLYYFTRIPPFPPGAHYMEGSGSDIGAFHGSEIIYVFDNLQLRDWPWTDVDRRLANVMSSYWVNFAKTGDPNGKGLPEWPAYNEKDEKVINLGATIHVDTVPRREDLDLLDKQFEAQRIK